MALIPQGIENVVDMGTLFEFSGISVIDGLASDGVTPILSPCRSLLALVGAEPQTHHRALARIPFAAFEAKINTWQINGAPPDLILIGAALYAHEVSCCMAKLCDWPGMPPPTPPPSAPSPSPSPRSGAGRLSERRPLPMPVGSM